jgi:hypothetical protein
MLANDPERISLLAVYLLEAFHNIGRTSEYAGAFVFDELLHMRRNAHAARK